MNKILLIVLILFKSAFSAEPKNEGTSIVFNQNYGYES